MVVDDEQAYTDVMVMVLQEYGFEPHPANSAQQAWSLLETVMPDLLLLDVMMPEVDGITFLNDLRGNGKLKEIPVLVITAYPETREQALNAGASGVLTKPFSAQELRESIGEFLSVNVPENPIFE